jgi:hypothetical protein
MRVGTLLASFFVLWAGLAAAADEKKEHHAAGGKNAGLEKFKLLAGEWVGKEPVGEKGMGDIRIKYKVTSGGSTVVETIAPDTDHEMVSMIHADGDALVLTHYCHLGNQPRMKAAGKLDGDKIEFKFADGTNMKAEKDMHMHEATFTFVDKDTLKTEWTLYQDGKAGHKVTFELKRKK